MSSRIGRSLASWPTRHPWAFSLGCLGTLAILTAFVCAIVAASGTYPDGVDALSYLYKGDLVYRSIGQGVWWPLYDPLWFNGVEAMRFWGPVPAYVLAGCEALAGGDPLHGFVAFCGIVFFIGAVTWTFVGMKIRRPWLGLFVGVLWFFLPNNLIALFYEGSLPRCLCLALLPMLVYLANGYLNEGGWKRLPAMVALFAITVLCDPVFAAMVAIAMVVFLVCHGVICREWKRSLAIVVALLLGCAVVGIWLVPSLIADGASTSSTQTMAGYFQSLALTLNPFERFTSENTKVYFGAATAALVVFGIVCAKRRSMPSFWAAAIIVLCTSELVFPALSKVSDGQCLWMLRFVSIALAFALFGFLTWRTMKTPLVVLVCALLVVDACPSWSLAYGSRNGADPNDRIAYTEQRMLVDQSKQVTTQRLALIDESRFGAESAYVATGFGDPLAITEGSVWQPSATTQNSTQLDQALESGKFDYLFDRSLELGNDSVLVLTSLAGGSDDGTAAHLDGSAARLGYQLVGENREYRLYHRDVPESFGVKSAYRAIAIGTSAQMVALQFPAFQEGDSNNLSDYTFDQLKDYDVVFLGGFTYDDRDAVQDMVAKLADAGVRVVIAADGVPADEHTGQRTFLGLDCEDITFSNGFPEFQTDEGAMTTTLFPNGHQQWSTVYVNGITHQTAVIREGDRTLPVCGTTDNPNVEVIGLNLTYYESLTNDANVQKLLAGVLGVDPDELPQRDVVELDVEYGADGRSVAIDSPEDGVCTTLAYQGTFTSDNQLTRHNNLLYVNAGKTVVTVGYPYLWQGAALSAAGVAGSVALFAIMRNRERKRESAKTKETNR